MIRWKRGALFREDPAAVAQQLDELGARPTAAQIVERFGNTETPLGRLLRHDDASAIHVARLGMARQIVCSLEELDDHGNWRPRTIHINVIRNSEEQVIRHCGYQRIADANEPEIDAGIETSVRRILGELRSLVRSIPKDHAASDVLSEMIDSLNRLLP